MILQSINGCYCNTIQFMKLETTFDWTIRNITIFPSFIFVHCIAPWFIITVRVAAIIVQLQFWHPANNLSQLSTLLSGGQWKNVWNPKEICGTARRNAAWSLSQIPKSPDAFFLALAWKQKDSQVRFSWIMIFPYFVLDGWRTTKQN